MPAARRAPWQTWKAGSSGPIAGLVLLFTPPFDHTPHDPGLHQRVPARHSRERRTIHPRRHLGGDRPGDPRAMAPGQHELFSLPQSDQSHEQPCRRAALQGRALCGGRGRLFGSAARRAWGLDVVHGLGRLDVPRRARVDPGISCACGKTSADAEHPRRLARLRNLLQARIAPLRDPRSKTPIGSATASLESSWMACGCPPGKSCGAGGRRTARTRCA